MSHKITDDFVRRHLIPDLRNPRITPFLVGPPAIGKSSISESLPKYGPFKVFAIEVNTLSEAGDFAGPRVVPNPNKDGEYVQVFFPHVVLEEANEYALEHPDIITIVLLDEINRGSDPGISSAAMTLTTGRRAGKLKFAPNIRFIATGNDKGNINTLDSASLSRFAIYPVMPDAETFLTYMGENLHWAIKQVLTENPEYIFMVPSAIVMQSTPTDDDDDDDDNSLSEAQMQKFASMLDNEQGMIQFTAPRTIEGLSMWLNEVGDDEINTMAIEPGINPRTNTETNELHVSLIAHTGDTVFTAAVNEKIVSALRAAAPTGAHAAGPTIVRPSSWDALRSAPTANDRERIINALSVNEQSALMVYALTITNASDQPLIQSVIDIVIGLGTLTSFGDDMATLLNRGTGGDLNNDSMNYFFSQNGPLTDSLSAMRQFLVR